MARARKTVLAESDLEEIWFYIALDNPEAADLPSQFSEPEPES